jgi:radical SAM superfamily enzyme YgiQ (UPF0313 family)
MDLVGDIFRPPSEADSLLLQVTVGCSHNRCTYCAMYRRKRFTVKPWEVVRRDIAQARTYGPVFDRVFLCDGDAMVLSTDRLRAILAAIREELPWVRRVATYGDTRGVLAKGVEELAELRALGLSMVYHGVETGDDDVMCRIQKGGTRAEVVQAAARLKEAGIAHSVIVMLGIGGVSGSAQHARLTASLLTQIDPPYVGALTTTVVPGTPLAQEQARGSFVLPDPFGMLGELATVVEEARFTSCRFSSNHASNYLPLRCQFPRDQDAALLALRSVITRHDENDLRPEWLRGL